MLFDWIFGHTQHDSASGSKYSRHFGKADGFGSAAGCVVFWVEVEHYLLTCKIGQRHGGSAVAGQRNFGGFAAWGQIGHGNSPDCTALVVSF